MIDGNWVRPCLIKLAGNCEDLSRIRSMKDDQAFALQINSCECVLDTVRFVLTPGMEGLAQEDLDQIDSEVARLQGRFGNDPYVGQILTDIRKQYTDVTNKNAKAATA